MDRFQFHHIKFVLLKLKCGLCHIIVFHLIMYDDDDDDDDDDGDDDDDDDDDDDGKVGMK